MTITLLILAGIALSAFFSGSETGFYRVTRVRLILDAKSGNSVAKALVWLVNRTTLLVATVLIGNNVANYLVSLGLLLFSQSILASSGESVQNLFPVVMTPLLFVYGELLPKHLFYQAPYTLLRRTAPIMLLFTILFFPISCLVMAIEGAWKKLVGRRSAGASSTLERQELQRVLLEGQEAGVVLPVQREIAQNLFTYAVRPVRQFAVPLRAITTVSQSATRDMVLEAARKTNQTTIGILAENQQSLAGCCSVVDLLVAPNDEALPVQATCRVGPNESNLTVLIRLQYEQCPLAEIVDARGRTLGVATRERLSKLLLADA